MGLLYASKAGTFNLSNMVSQLAVTLPRCLALSSKLYPFFVNTFAELISRFLVLGGIIITRVYDLSLSLSLSLSLFLSRIVCEDSYAPSFLMIKANRITSAFFISTGVLRAA